MHPLRLLVPFPGLLLVIGCVGAASPAQETGDDAADGTPEKGADAGGHSGDRPDTQVDGDPPDPPPGSANAPPQLQRIGDKRVAPGATLDIVLSATDPDGDEVRYAVYGRMPEGARFEKAKARFSWTPMPAQEGIETVLTFAASDGEAEARETIRITVAAVGANVPPEFVPLGDQVATAGEPFELQLRAIDPDSSVLTYGFDQDTEVPEGATVEPTQGLFRWTPTAAHACQSSKLTFVVTDGQAADTLTLTLVVADETGNLTCNRPPAIEPIGNRAVEPGQTLIVRVIASDPDGDALEFSVEGAPEGARLERRGDQEHLFEWRPGQAAAGRSWQVTFVVTDVRPQGQERLAARESIVVTVGGDAPPVIEPDPAPEDCARDAMEPNDNAMAAREMAAGAYADLQICPGDEDWFRVQAPADKALVATIRFEHAMGDLDLELLPADAGEVVDRADGVSDLERVAVAGTDADTTWLLRVFGFLGRQRGPYDLEVELIDCLDDELEDNDTRDSATPIELDEAIDGLVVCPGDEDWLSFEVEAGARVDLQVMFAHDAGDLDAYLYAPAEVAALARGISFDDDESIVIDSAPVAGRYLLKVTGWRSPRNTYDLLVRASDGCAPDGSEPNDDPDNAAPLAADETLPDLLYCGDADWYLLPVPDGASVLLTLQTDDPHLRMHLYEPDGQSLIADDELDDRQRTLFEIGLVGGEYLVLVDGGAVGSGYALETIVD